MKITFVSPPPNLSGGVRVIALHAARLQAMGHDVTVIAPTDPHPTLRDRARATLRGMPLPKPLTRTPYDDECAPFRSLPHAGPVTDADVPDADAVIATWWETAPMVAALSPAKGRKFYFVQHHEVFSPLPANLAAATYRLPLQKITVAGWLTDTMRNLYGDATAITVPNAVDHARFHAPPRDRNTPPAVGFLYAPLPVKGTDLAIAAVTALKARLPDLRAITFGTHPAIGAFPLPDWVEFILNPPHDQIRQIYTRFDAFLMASRAEGFGMTVTEAMACRCPITSTRTGCAPDLIRPGLNGYLCNTEDVTAMTDALHRILTAPAADWRAMSDAAHAAVAGYTWHEATNRFESALISRL
jgi:glycosyltransferase involved in cell wall biosynthesis